MPVNTESSASCANIEEFFARQCMSKCFGYVTKGMRLHFELAKVQITDEIQKTGMVSWCLLKSSI